MQLMESPTPLEGKGNSLSRLTMISFSKLVFANSLFSRLTGGSGGQTFGGLLGNAQDLNVAGLVGVGSDQGESPTF